MWSYLHRTPDGVYYIRMEYLRTRALHGWEAGDCAVPGSKGRKAAKARDIRHDESAHALLRQTERDRDAAAMPMPS